MLMMINAMATISLLLMLEVTLLMEVSRVLPSTNRDDSDIGGYAGDLGDDNGDNYASVASQASLQHMVPRMFQHSHLTKFLLRRFK